MNSKHATELLGLLPGSQQEVLRLRLVHGLSAEQTATVPGCTPADVRLTQHQALEVLCKELAIRNGAARGGPRQSSVSRDRGW